VVLACALAQKRHIKVTAAGLTLSILGVAAVLGVKWLLGVLTTEISYLRAFTVGAALDLFFSWFTLGNALTPGGPRSSIATRIVASGIIAVTGVLLATWLVVGWRHLDRWRWLMHLLLLLAVPGLLLALNALGLRNYYIERSALTSLPFFYLAVATGAALIANARLRRLAVGATLVGATLVLVAFRSNPDDWTVYKPNPDWRAAAREITQYRASATERLTLLSTTPLKELIYYMPGAAECPWPPAAAQSQPTISGIKGALARRFRKSPTLTCGAAGSATIRLYVVEDATPEWADEIRSYENGARSLLILNAYWRGKTPALLRSLRASGRELRAVARAKGLEVFSLDSR